MRQFFLVLLLLINCGRDLAQVPAIQWQQSLGGSNLDASFAVRQTTDGGYVVAGYSSSTDGNVSGNHGNADCWVVKLNNAGSIEWQKSLGGSGADYANDIRQTSDSGYILAGWSFSDDSEVSGNHGNGDYWIVKLSAACAIQWQKCLGGSDEDVASAIQQTTVGGYIVTGYTYSVDGEVSGHHGGDTTYDYWVVKLNDTGAIQWEKCLGGTNNDNATSIQQTADGGYVVAGTAYSTDGDVVGNHGFQDYWVVKLSDTGAIQWAKCLGGTESDWCYGIQQTTDSGYIVAGSSYSNDGDVSGNHGDFDYWIVKLNGTGAIQWQKSLGGSDIDVANAIQQTTDGGYIIVGYTISNDSEVFRESWQPGLLGCKNKRYRRHPVAKVYGRQPGRLRGQSVQQTPGGYIVTGYSASSDGDVTGNHGSNDYWVVKLECTAAVLTGDSVVCVDSTIRLTNSVTGGVWSVTNTSASIIDSAVRGVVTGRDTVVYTLNNACGITTAAFAVSVGHCPTEVPQVPSNDNISVVPNPSSGVLYILGTKSATIEIINTLGQLVGSGTNVENISINNLPQGVYSVRIFDNNMMLMKQQEIIKK